MAITTVTTSTAAGVNYTRTTDNSTDWSGITGNTYFYDKTDKIVYYKNTSGIVVNAYDTFTGGIVSGSTNFISGLTANTISATTYQNLPTDVNVTGGTYSAGTITFTNNTGGTFNVTGLTTGSTSTITGATSLGTGVTIFDSVVNGNIQINSITGDTLEKITTSLSANTIQVGINEQNLTLWPLVVNGNRLIDGSVSYVSGLTFDISPLNYIIDGELYNIPSSTQVTLNSGDSTFDRIDVIFADISGNTGVLEGTPSANPEKPIVDSDSQVEVTFVSIPANSTTADINAFIIYNENSGPPSEWTFGAVGLQPTRISGSSTDQAYSGSTSIRVSGVTGAFTTSFRLTGSTILDTNEYATLQFAMKNLSANTTTSQIRIRFYTSGGTSLGQVLMNAAGSSGFVQYSSNNTSSWQLISIPLWRFYLTNTNIQIVEFSFNSPNARYYFDLIEFVEGFASSPPSNSWTTIKGDGATTITAPNPNATLTISGGTNIGSFISGTSTVVLNLDNNINLNGVTASTISATTYQNLPDNVTGNYLPLSGGTVTGQTFFTSGVTITGDTLINDTSGITALDTSTRELVSSNNQVSIDWENRQLKDENGSATLVWSSQRTLEDLFGASLDWGNKYLYKSDGSIVLDWENGILTGQTNIQSSTISATTYQNLPDNVTGLYLPLSGGTVSGNTTITANLTVSGNSGVNWFSSNTSSDLVRITQTGVGNAFVVEDNTNPDSTPFIINSGGSVSVGTTSVFSVGAGTETKLNVSTGSSGVATTGLSVSTPVIIESAVGTSVGLLNPDVANSQIYFGTPSDPFGSYLRWDYTNRNLILATANSTGKLIFQTANAVEVARIDQSGNMGIGLTGATQKLEVSGNTRIYGSMSAQTGYISGSGQNILTVIGSGNSTTSPLFSVQGSSGELFSVTDSLVGSLFSVNDISGLPIMEVFSDNTTLWGSYQAPSLNTTTRTSLTAGTNTIYSIPTSAYTGAFFEYTLISSGATGARAGQIMSIWSGSTANFTETTTTDIGTTTGVTFTVAISGNNAVLSSSATTAGWTVKTIIRSI